MPSTPRSTNGPARWWHETLIGALAGVLVALSLPPFGWWPLGWAGVAVLAWRLPGRSWRGRLALGAGLGIADYVIGLLWVQEFSVAGYVGVVLISALYAVLAVVLVPTGRRLYVAVGLPCVLVLTDWARDHFPLGGLPLAGLALGQVSGPLAPALRLGGGLGLVAATAIVGVALAELARLALGATRRGRATAVAATATAAAATATAAAAAATAAATVAALVLPVGGALSPSGAGGHLPPLRVGLVQGGGPRGTRAINTDPQVVFDRALTASAALSGPLDLIVWPEGMLQSHAAYQTSPDAEALAGLAIQHGATVVAGVEQDVGATKYLNEVVVWDGQGRVAGTYVKNHLVPFGEYVPFRSVIHRLFNVADVPLDAIPGRTAGFLRTPAAPLAVMISYEVFFDERARGGVRAGGQVLVVPTNTASYRSTQVPTQEVAADRMRAWETGRWLVQVTPTGYSTVISPTGQITRKSHLDAASVIEATVPRRTGQTVYDVVGDLTVVLLALAGWAVVAGMAVGRAVATGRTASRRRGGASRPASRRRGGASRPAPEELDPDTENNDRSVRA